MELYVNSDFDQENNQNDALYENQEGLKRSDHQYRDLEVNHTNLKPQTYEQTGHFKGNTEYNDLTIVKTSRRAKGCCCALGFVLGCVFATSICLVIQFLLLPYLESTIHDTLHEVKIPSICSDDWILYKENCYYLSTYNKSWEDAQELCKMSSSFLTDINDREEADWLARIVGQNINASIWIGGRGVNSTNFKWYYNKNNIKDMNFTDWAPRQPSYPEQNCIQMWKGKNYKWDNELCFLQRQFVCKRSIK